jgi:NOL1/NOP2/sun family putative RNA methylase
MSFANYTLYWDDMKPTLLALPTHFLDRLREILGSENYANYIEIMQSNKLTTFRVNTLLTTTSALLSDLAANEFTIQPVPWCDTAFSIPSTQKRLLTETKAFRAGQLYIQNASSIFASLVLQPQPGEEIMDLAAAPGGKTLHIAALMANQGRIAAIEAVKSRFFRLKSNVQQAGATSIRAYLKDGAHVWRLVPKRFDRVLLDAPCSSEARIHIEDPSSYDFWSEKKIVEMSRKQKKLIYSAIKSLKSGGTLVYCTCSFAPEENEEIVQYALDKFTDTLTILPITTPFDNYQPGLLQWQNKTFASELKYAVRILPTNAMSGFFICKLQKL